MTASDVPRGTPSAVSVSAGAFEDPDTPEFGKALAWALTRSAASREATRLLGGDVRYVLTSGGDIAGIVNPPRPQSWYEVADRNASDPEEWRTGAERHGGTWWEDWASWSAERAGSLVSPPQTGSAEHPPLGEAPGEYVHS